MPKIHLSVLIFPLLLEASWSSPLVLPHTFLGPIFSSDLGVDSFGGVHVVYDRDVYSDNLIPVADEIMYLYRLPGAKDWYGPINVSSTPNQSSFPTLILDTLRAPWIFWLEDNGDTLHQIIKRTDYYWTRGEEGGFRPPQSLFHAPSGNTNIEDGVALLDSWGRPSLLFPAVIPSDYNDLWFTFYDSTFVDPMLLPLRGSYVQPIFEGEILYLGFIGPPLSGDGKNIVSYAVVNPTKGSLESGPNEIYNGGTNLAFELNLLRTSSGYYAVWDEDTTGDLFPDRLLTARSQDGKIWSQPYAFEYEPGTWFELDGATSEEGLVHLVGAFISVGGISRIVYLVFDPERGWGTPEVLDSCSIAEGVVEAPRIFVDEKGRAYSIWTRRVNTGEGAPEYFLMFSENQMTDVRDGQGKEGADDLFVYPSIFWDHLRIETRGEEESMLKVSIFDVTGRLLLEIEGKGRIDWKGRDKMENPLPRGVYFVSVDVRGRNRIFKVLKTR